MFGISFSEIAFLCIIILLVFGPDRLPEMAKTVGGFLGLIKKNTDEIRKDFYNSVYTPLEDIESKIKLQERKLRAIGKDFIEEENTKLEGENKNDTTKPKKSEDKS